MSLCFIKCMYIQFKSGKKMKIASIFFSNISTKTNNFKFTI